MKVTGPDGNEIELPEHETAVWTKAYVTTGRWEACCLCGWYLLSEMLPVPRADALFAFGSAAGHQHVSEQAKEER